MMLSKVSCLFASSELKIARSTFSLLLLCVKEKMRNEIGSRVMLVDIARSCLLIRQWRARRKRIEIVGLACLWVSGERENPYIRYV